MNKREIFTWARNVMYSCLTKQQLNNSMNLIDNYAKLFGKDKYHKELVVRMLFIIVNKL